MIAFLKGVLAAKTATTAFIEVNGVGYAVGMSQASLSKLPEAGAAVEVHTFLQVRDDGLSLFGFLTLEEKALFERLIGGVVGTIIGCLTGYFGGVADLILMRVCDAITAFPSILLALVLITIIGQGKYPIILILGILFIPSFARVVRGEVAKQRNMNYVASARLMGASHLRIIFRHILPNTVQVLLPILAIGFNNAVLAEASMSYLGVGVLPPDASLGRMLAEAQTYLGRAPWYALFVGLAIVLLILGLSLLTEGLQQKRRS